MTEYKTGAVVDFIAKGTTPDIWRMVLVEEGPWDEITVELTRLQDRLYECIDAALDGQVARKFPDTHGKTIILQLDGYNLPILEVSEFFDAFSNNVMKIEDYAQALRDSDFVSDIKFQLNLEVT